MSWDHNVDGIVQHHSCRGGGGRDLLVRVHLSSATIITTSTSTPRRRRLKGLHHPHPYPHRPLHQARASSTPTLSLSSVREIVIVLVKRSPRSSSSMSTSEQGRQAQVRDGGLLVVCEVPPCRCQGSRFVRSGVHTGTHGHTRTYRVRADIIIAKLAEVTSLLEKLRVDLKEKNLFPPRE